MSTRRTLTGASMALASLGLLGGTAAADGDPPAAVGWWTRAPGASAAPDGGFEVAALGSEPASVAALRFDVSGTPTAATLTLVESGGTVTPATALQVCTTTAPWEPANPGAYDDAPEADCAAAVDLTRDEEAAEWTAEVGSLLAAGSLMIVPADTPGGGSPLDPGFRVTFSEAALAVVATPSVSSSPAFAQPTPGGGAYSSPATSSTAGGFGGGGGSDFTVTPAPAGAPEAGTTVTTVAVDEELEEGDGGGAEEAFGAPELVAGAGGSRGGGKPWGRLLVLAPLSAVVGVVTVEGQKRLARRGVAVG